MESRFAGVNTVPAIESNEEDGEQVLWLIGAWLLPNIGAIVDILPALRLQAPRPFVIDGSRLEALDTSAGFVLIRHLADLGCTPAMVRGRGFDPRHSRLLRLVHEHMGTPSAEAHSAHMGLVQGVGAGTLRLASMLRLHVGFIGAITLEALAALRRPQLLRVRETVSQFESAGIDAIPIVLLVNFLIGMVVAYVLGAQAQQFGASVYVADGTALAMCRELTPLLASIMVAGRSGAAFTAQIGTMKLNQELDAIRMLGLSPLQVLVLPRVAALALALPLLVFVGDIAGLAGGMLVCATQLNVAPDLFLDRVHAVLGVRQVALGVLKAPVFAVFIALIGCRMGIFAERDARSVGNNTTSTVVQCIVWVIVLDAGFALLYQSMGI
jgi:phospholipid/cholesterol/gamma-HCH transport system permease protein